MKMVEKFIAGTEGFEGHPVCKTIVNKLVPVGKTREFVKEFGILEKDTARSEGALKAKALADRAHKKFLSETLERLELPVKNYLQIKRKMEEDKDKKAAEALKKEEASLRKAVSSSFASASDFDKLFTKEIFDELVPPLCSESEMETVRSFKGFYTYFTDYHMIRKRLYSADEKAGTAAFRIVNENLPLFFLGLKNLEKVKAEAPALLIQPAFAKFAALLSGAAESGAFRPGDSFIAEFNSCISGTFDERGKQVSKGMNQLVKEYMDAEKGVRLPFFKPLLKNVLADSEPLFAVASFETSSEAFSAFMAFAGKVLPAAREFASFLKRSVPSLKSVFVEEKSFEKFSFLVYGRPFAIKAALAAAEEKPASGEGATLLEIERAVRSIPENDTLPSVSAYLEKLSKISFAEKFSAARAAEGADFRRDKKRAVPLKEFLQESLDYYNALRLSSGSPDTAEGIEYETASKALEEALASIVPLYNKTRNFVTKSYKEERKIRLNFENSQLMSGWDVNYESKNKAAIFSDEASGKFYLAIFNPQKKAPEISEDPSSPFKKLCVKLLPGPNKTLPHVAFSAKGLEKYKPSEALLEKYKKGLHKKGEGFDLGFCHELIDFFKSVIARTESWKDFSFEFSPTESYGDISGFYREVDKGGYKAWLSGVSKEEVFALAEDGNAFLFEIYNRHLAGKAHGRDLPTEMFRSLFSLSSSVQLNGNAQVYWRPALSDGSVTHKKGSWLVNKTLSDGKAVSDEDWKSAYEYLNFGRPLSASAKALMDSEKLVFKKADRDIIKDRRYSEESFTLHLPLTLNWAASPLYPKAFNERVLEAFAGDPAAKILAVNRGESNLVYSVLMDKSGKMLERKSYNLVGEGGRLVDYKSKLEAKAAARDRERKDWQDVSKIRDLKDGYMSRVVAAISRSMVDNDAVLVMEDLTSEFKSSRSAIESSVYQKFETALLTKLSFLALKEREAEEPGGLMKPYQLAPKIDSLAGAGRQAGFVFFANPAYMSRIDPETGTANAFNFGSLATAAQKTAFLEGFGITAGEDYVRFDCDLGGFNSVFAGARQSMTASGSRVLWSREEKKYAAFDLSEEAGKLRSLLAGQEPTKEELGKPQVRNALLRLLSACAQMKTRVLDESLFVPAAPGKSGFEGLPSDCVTAFNLANKFRLALASEKGLWKYTVKDYVLALQTHGLAD